MKGKSFCFLESDERTYQDFLMYYQMLGERRTPFDIDMMIQKREMERHLAEHHLSPHDQRAICDWINRYSSGFRSYLNSLKMVAMFQYYHNRWISEEELPSFEVFCTAVDFWNREKNTTVDSIFI